MLRSVPTDQCPVHNVVVRQYAFECFGSYRDRSIRSRIRSIFHTVEICKERLHISDVSWEDSGIGLERIVRKENTTGQIQKNKFDLLIPNM